MLEINSTLLIQIANFLLLIFLLNLFLYKPIRDILARRNNEMNAMDKMIKDYGERALQHEKGIEEGAVLARKEGFLEKERFKNLGLEQEADLLKEAGSTSEEKIGKAKRELEEKLAAMRKSLDDQVSLFSRELAEKVLGRSLQ